MNPKIQFDRHPDADALNAFAEQALPVADRARILAHMASCARCREVVYLAQAAAQPEPAPAIAIKAQPQWSWASAFAKWRIALIPAAALAAAVAAAVWVQTRPAPPPAQMAKVSELPPAPPGSDLAPKAQQRSAPPPAAISPRQPVALPPRPPAAFAARTQPLPQSEQNKAMPPAAGTMDPNAVALTAASAPPSLAASTAQTRALAPTHLDAHSASRARYNPVPAPSVPPPALSLTPSSLTPQLEPQPEAVRRPVPIGNVAAAAESPAPQPLNGFAPMLPARPVNLPSGKSAVSSAVILNRLLAVDSAGAVFLSQDAGKHWETVDPKWTGKAIQVEARPQNPYRLSNAEVSVEPPPPPADAAAKAVPPLPAMVFRLVTDRRQTWVSADGKVWHEQ